MQPVRTGQGPSPQQHLEHSSFLDLGQPGHTHDPVFCGASEALRGGTGLRGLEVLVQCLLEMRSLRCQIPQPVRNRSGSQIQSSGPSSSTLNIWPAASCSCGSPYVSNTSCLSGDPEAALAWQSQNSDSRVCRALTTSWSSSQTRQARLNDLEGA